MHTLSLRRGSNHAAGRRHSQTWQSFRDQKCDGKPAYPCGHAKRGSPAAECYRRSTGARLPSPRSGGACRAPHRASSDRVRDVLDVHIAVSVVQAQPLGHGRSRVNGTLHRRHVAVRRLIEGVWDEEVAPDDAQSERALPPRLRRHNAFAMTNDAHDRRPASHRHRRKGKKRFTKCRCSISNSNGRADFIGASYGPAKGFFGAGGN